VDTHTIHSLTAEHLQVKGKIMAYYARLNQNNEVEQVVGIANSEEPTEAAGIAYCEQLFKGGRWIKTSYNGTIRKNFAGIGYTYDQFRDAFIAPKRFASFIFNETLCQWEPPVPKPDDGRLYRWDEITLSWIALS
jgi:hypothetical protein